MPRRRRQWPWEAVAGAAAVAGVVVAAVLGVAQLLTAAPDDQPPAADADSRLELVDVEFSQQPVMVTVLDYVDPEGNPVVLPTTEATAGAPSEERHALVITLRNNADQPAVLTGVKLVVHETMLVVPCSGQIGGGVAPSLNYDFRFPAPVNATKPWSALSPLNFTVDPRSVDALSITVGPEISDSGWTLLLWRFSIYGVTKGGTETLWGHGVSMDPMAGTKGQFDEFVRGPSPEENTPEKMSSCARERQGDIEAFTRARGGAVIHPGTDALLAAYRRLGATA